MALIKHGFPILEYDDAQSAVIMPDRAGEYQFPEYAVFPFLGEEVDAFARANGCPVIGEFVNATKTFPVYQVTYKERNICLCQAPVGAAAAVQLMDWLIGYGAKKIISAGSCGVLVPMEENEFLIPTTALRCEGTSYHYLPPSRTVEADPNSVAAIERAFIRNSVRYSKCKTWTTDGFFRETKDMVEYRKAEGYTVVEMECSALMACAQFRGVRFGQFLYTADTLADVDAHDDRDWGQASVCEALQLCLDAVIEL